MKIMILSHKPDVFSVQRLVAEIEAAGHTSVVMNPDDEEFKKVPADLVIPRLGSYRFEESLRAVEWLERRRTPLLNRPTALRDARNKWVSYLILREEGLPVLQTQSLAKKDLPRHFPYVVKTHSLARGEGVLLIESAADLLALPDLGEEWLWQEYVNRPDKCDYRLLASPHQLIAAMERRAKPGEFRTNLHQGGSAHPFVPTEFEIRLACRAVEALGLDLGGVDLIRTPSGPAVMEVNGCPGFEGLEAASGVNVAQEYVRWCERRVEQHPS